MTTGSTELAFSCTCGKVGGVLIDVGPRGMIQTDASASIWKIIPPINGLVDRTSNRSECFRWIRSTSKGDRVVCHCGDCQNFARYLGAADRILGPYGGTDLYQGRCAKMRLAKGAEHLSCLHLTDKPTLRWFASCCRTPMFNTYANGRVPYVTALLANCDKSAVDARLGPVLGHLFLPDGGDILPGAPRMSMGKLMRRFFKRMVRDMMSGDRRRSALFDPKTLEPISQPYRLTKAEQSALA